jgi:hypothetical protein
MLRASYSRISDVACLRAQSAGQTPEYGPLTGANGLKLTGRSRVASAPRMAWLGDRSSCLLCYGREGT